MLDKRTMWYFAQVFIKGTDVFTTMRFVVFADSKAEAEELAAKKIQSTYPGKGYQLHLYLKTYIKEARQLVAQENYVGVKPDYV